MTHYWLILIAIWGWRGALLYFFKYQRHHGWMHLRNWGFNFELGSPDCWFDRVRIRKRSKSSHIERSGKTGVWSSYCSVKSSVSLLSFLGVETASERDLEDILRTELLLPRKPIISSVEGHNFGKLWQQRRKSPPYFLYFL